MSHSKERHEKICLNCNAALYGRYCHVCGQENIEPKETVWGLISHFFYDITHFDGKFFSTTRYLITRPGFLPQEYIIGRRARYLHPIRMYVFSSAIFFLFLFSMFNIKDMKWNEKDKEDRKAAEAAGLRFEHTDRSNDTKPYRYHDANVNKSDSAANKKDTATAGDKTDSDDDDDSDLGVTLQPEMKKGADTGKRVYTFPNTINIIDPEEKYTSIAAYDSTQRALPANKRDSWLRRAITHRNIELHNRFGNNREEMFKELLEKFMHTFPYLLFVSLPLYALYLKLLYVRRKQFLYVSHGIFLIYLYIFTFILLLVYFAINKIHTSLDWDWLGWLEGILLLYGIYYAYKAMRKFYGQGRFKTILKFCILNTLAFFSVIFLFAVFFLFAALRF